MSSISKERYPRSVDCAGVRYDIGLMRSSDGAAVDAFLTALPRHDLLFLSKDVTHPKVISAWMAALSDDPTVERAEAMAANLLGAHRAVLRLREALLRRNAAHAG